MKQKFFGNNEGQIYKNEIFFGEQKFSLSLFLYKNDDEILMRI